MTFREFLNEAFLLPGTIVSGVLDLLLGNTKKKVNADTKKEEVVYDENDQPEVNRGLFGSILDGIKFGARAFADFIHNHRKAIAIAFWASLAVAGLAALSVFLAPIVLPAAATFTAAVTTAVSFVFGSTVAGTTAGLIGGGAALAFAATSAAIYLSALVVNSISAAVGFFKEWSAKRAAAKQGASTGEEVEYTASNDSELSNTDELTGSATKMQGLGQPVSQSKKEDPKPVHITKPKASHEEVVHSNHSHLQC
ncbi:MAG: hypothetical protein ACRCXC_00680 [Legionella sp.]